MTSTHKKKVAAHSKNDYLLSILTACFSVGNRNPHTQLAPSLGSDTLTLTTSLLYDQDTLSTLIIHAQLSPNPVKFLKEGVQK